MARNGSGTYNLLTNSWNPATNGVSATAVDWQNLINDVAAALTQSLSADGQTPMTGNLNAGNNKITGLAAGTSSGQSIRWEQVFTAPASFGGGAINVDASGNVGVATGSPNTKLDVAGGFTSDFWRGRSNGSAPVADCAVYRPADNTLGFSTANTERVRVDASGNVGIGVTPNPWAANHTAIQLTSAGTQVWADDSQAAWFSTNTYASASGTYRYISSAAAGAYAISRTTGVHSWRVAASGTAGNIITWTQAMTLDTSGNLLLTSTTGGLGYGIGSGGTVTQATSKSTAVTLNRPSGQITMNNAALAAGASVVFRVNNSLVALTDCVLVQPSNAGTQAYACQVVTTSTGLFDIRVTNYSGGSLSEALVINFAVIKGSIS